MFTCVYICVVFTCVYLSLTVLCLRLVFECCVESFDRSVYSVFTFWFLVFTIVSCVCGYLCLPREISNHSERLFNVSKAGRSYGGRAG